MVLQKYVERKTKISASLSAHLNSFTADNRKTSIGTHLAEADSDRSETVPAQPPPQTSSMNIPIPGSSMCPLTITTTNMTDTEVNCAIEDAKCADQELLLNGKVFSYNKTTLNALEEDNWENSELDLASNLS